MEVDFVSENENEQENDNDDGLENEFCINRQTTLRFSAFHGFDVHFIFLYVGKEAILKS